MDYDFIYYPDRRILEKVKTKEKIDLLFDEHLLILFLISRQDVSVKSLKALFDTTEGAIRTKKCRLCQKTGVVIQSKREYGYKLISRIKEEV